MGVSEGNFFMVGKKKKKHKKIVKMDPKKKKKTKKKSDLHDQKSMNQVVQNIVALSRVGKISFFFFKSNMKKNKSEIKFIFFIVNQMPKFKLSKMLQLF